MTNPRSGQRNGTMPAGPGMFILLSTATLSNAAYHTAYDIKLQRQVQAPWFLAHRTVCDAIFLPSCAASALIRSRCHDLHPAAVFQVPLPVKSLACRPFVLLYPNAAALF